MFNRDCFHGIWNSFVLDYCARTGETDGRYQEHSFSNSIRSLEHSFPGPFVPWNFRSRERINPADLSLDYDRSNTKLIVWVKNDDLKSKSTRPTLETRWSKMERSRERKFQGTNGQGNECSREWMVPRTKVPSRERMFQEQIVLRTNIPDTGENKGCGNYRKLMQSTEKYRILTKNLTTEN